ncbi:hypothetical protein Gasu2_36320 [Galdieria sulphuraria]|nr:hypothetical protein Gasu2_36320 [Galdieria sulphuraria]
MDIVGFLVFMRLESLGSSMHTSLDVCAVVPYGTLCTLFFKRPQVVPLLFARLGVEEKGTNSYFQLKWCENTCKELAGFYEVPLLLSLM